MNKIGNVTFGKLDVRFLLENISFVAAQDSVQIPPFLQMSRRKRAPSDSLSAAIPDKSRQTSKEMCRPKVTELSWDTDEESLTTAHFQGWIKQKYG